MGQNPALFPGPAVRIPGVEMAGVARMCPPGLRAGKLGSDECRPGAVTDPLRAPPVGPTLEANALKSLANELQAQTRKEDAQTAQPVTKKTITKQHGRLLFYVRGCDRLKVHLAPGLVERDAFEDLKSFQHNQKRKLRELGIPNPFNNRKIMAFVKFGQGGRSVGGAKKKGEPHRCRLPQGGRDVADKLHPTDGR